MTVVLVAFAVLVVWVVSLYVHPFGKCPRCKGTGNITRGVKAPVCPRCKGLKQQQRFGSRTVHRTIRMIRAERARTRQQKASKS